MKPFYLKYNKESFWKEYWEKFRVDHQQFVQKNIYPIKPVLEYANLGGKILECGFGGGRVVRHLSKLNVNVIGVEYDLKIVNELKETDPDINVMHGDILDLDFPDDCFDTSLCFGVLGGLHNNTAKAVQELTRVTRTGGTLIISVMLDNTARFFQKQLNRFAQEEEEFYAWMDSEQGWESYFESFGLTKITSSPIVSRYNIYYWSPFLRSRKESDLTAARVDEKEYKLNWSGELFWFLHRTILRQHLAAGITFILRNDK